MASWALASIVAVTRNWCLFPAYSIIYFFLSFTFFFPPEIYYSSFSFYFLWDTPYSLCNVTHFVVTTHTVKKKLIILFSSFRDPDERNLCGVHFVILYVRGDTKPAEPTQNLEIHMLPFCLTHTPKYVTLVKSQPCTTSISYILSSCVYADY